MENLPIGFIVFYLAIILLVIISIWRVFEKADQPGWAAIIPIYNLVVMAKIAGKPAWWGLLPLIPFLGIIWNIWIINLIAKNFGKDEGFTVGLVLLGFIFWPILGFGPAQYRGKIPQVSDPRVLDQGMQ